MLSFFNIWTIARFEIKTLLRSWFFRIFCGLILIILTFMNVILFTSANKEIPWEFRGIPASISYFNMLLLNIAQAIMAIFLATDFLKRDRSDTTETIYMRSMSNGDYVLGKLSGLLLVFGGLNVLVLLISAVIQIVFSDVPFSFSAHFAYFLLISLPTLIFIFGLAFFMMSLVRNQAVTFILLLGYLGISLIVLNNKFYAAFDSVGFFLPLAYSDFIGFSNLSLLMMQRLSFLFIGLGLIFVTILLFKRLPQSRAMQIASAVLAVLFLLLGPIMFASYYQQSKSGLQRREQARTLNENAPKTVCTISRYDLDVQHLGDRIEATAKIQIENRSDLAISELIFSLNPGLAVLDVKLDGVSVAFKRSLHLLTVTPAAPLAVDQRSIVELNYRGAIDESITYLQTPEEERAKLTDVMLYKIDKRTALITPSFVLLTPESNWYPIAGATEGKSLLTTRVKSFSEFSLRVHCNDRLLPISQGRRELEDGVFVFRPQEPLPQLSLIIGPYRQRSLEVDNVTYHLYTHTKHGYFEPYVSQVGDTLHTMIRDLKNAYEKLLGINYPYRDLSLIEVPIHFASFTSPMRFNDEFIQPMQVLIPENGITINSADFKAQLNRMTNRSQSRNQTMSEKEQQYLVVQRFLQGTFLYNLPGRPFGPTNQRLYSIFPNFYTFVNYVSMNKMPVLDAALDIYLRGKAELQAGGFMRFRSGLTDEEKANLRLRDHSLEQILQSPEDVALVSSALKSKSAGFFRMLEGKMGSEKLTAFLTDGLERHQFQPWLSDEWVPEMNNHGVDLNAEYEAWYKQTQTPGFMFSNIQNYSVVKQDRARYQIKFTVTNPTAVDGIIVTDFQLRGQDGPGGGGGGGFGGGFFMQASAQTDYQRIIQIPAGQAKQIALITDEEPRSMIINTMVSQNLPMQITHRFERFEENNKLSPVEEEIVLDQSPSGISSDEFIVDNESPGFQVLTQKKRIPLQRFFKIEAEAEEEYVPLRPWQIPDHWVKTINSDFYGDMVLSAHFIRTGDGSQKVAWQTELPEAGNYSVYAFVTPIRMRGPRDRGNFVQEHYFIIYHDDGSEEVQVDASAGEGWTMLGSFYFSQGEAKVELSNQSKGRVVIADAVKWVKR